jgi:hypothetical protein
MIVSLPIISILIVYVVCGYTTMQAKIIASLMKRIIVTTRIIRAPTTATGEPKAQRESDDDNERGGDVFY